jgi:hypothetical protein
MNYTLSDAGSGQFCISLHTVYRLTCPELMVIKAARSDTGKRSGNEMAITRVKIR